MNFLDTDSKVVQFHILLPACRSILGPKEGLGLLNGAAASVGVASLCLYETNQLMVLSEAIIGLYVRGTAVAKTQNLAEYY